MKTTTEEEKKKRTPGPKGIELSKFSFPSPRRCLALFGCSFNRERGENAPLASGAASEHIRRGMREPVAAEQRKRRRKKASSAPFANASINDSFSTKKTPRHLP